MKPERFKHLRRFSLRTMFVLMTVCCLLVGAWSVYVNPFRLEQQSLATVNRLQGNSAKTGAEGPAWQRWLVTTFLGEDAYVHVTQVDLSGSQVDDKDMPSLSGLTHLEKLNLDNTQITDDGTAVLRAMPALKELSLRYTHVSDRTASHIAALPALQTVTLTGAKMTDAAIVDLGKHSVMKELYIRWTHLTNPGADRLRAALPNCAIHFHALDAPIAETSPAN